MKIITVSVNDNILREFRETAEEKFGHSKGFLDKAFDEALRLWVKES